MDSCVCTKNITDFQRFGYGLYYSMACYICQHCCVVLGGDFEKECTLMVCDLRKLSGFSEFGIFSWLGGDTVAF